MRWWSNEKKFPRRKETSCMGWWLKKFKKEKKPLVCVGVARVLLLGLATADFVVPPVVPPGNMQHSYIYI